MSVKIKLTYRCDTCGTKNKQVFGSMYYVNSNQLISGIDINLPEGWTVKNFEIQCNTCSVKEPQVQ